MEQQPSFQVSQCAKVKPRLLVCDDDAAQLASYCAKLSEHYDVEGVLVSKHKNYDDVLRHAFHSKDWNEAGKALHIDAENFDFVRHLITSKDELHALLKERKPDFILSDFQMREHLSGIEVLHAAKKLCPDSVRAMHTGATCALPVKVSLLKESYPIEHQHRQDLVKAMHHDRFRIFSKSPYHHDFNPKPIEAYFAETTATRSIS